MKKTYHLCLSAGNEILFRCKPDFIRGINCLCIAAWKTGSSLLAYSFMSNHVHICIRSEHLNEFKRTFWYAYNRYFNKKYHREGRLGEPDFFELKIEGLYHLLTCIAYILRNPMHHGVTGTPFGYPYSSIRALFRKDFGWNDEDTESLDRKHSYKYLPNQHHLPETFKMDCHGMIVPWSSIDLADVEHQYSTARTFLYYMNRLSGEKWEKEQSQDATALPPITLHDIEHGVKYQDMRTMLGNEYGRSNYNNMTDLQICNQIDTTILPTLGKESIYQLSETEKERIAQHLIRKYHLPITQVCRCLALHVHEEMAKTSCSIP